MEFYIESLVARFSTFPLFHFFVVNLLVFFFISSKWRTFFSLVSFDFSGSIVSSADTNSDMDSVHYSKKACTKSEDHILSHLEPNNWWYLLNFDQEISAFGICWGYYKRTSTKADNLTNFCSPVARVCIFFVSYFSVEMRLIWLSSTDSFINVPETSKMKMNKTISNQSKFFFPKNFHLFISLSFALSASLDVCTLILKLVGRSFYRVRMKSFIVSSPTSVIWLLYICRCTFCYS